MMNVANGGQSKQTTPPASEGPTAALKPYRIVRSVLVFAAIGAILYAAVALSSNYDAVVSALVSFPVTYLGIVIVLVLFGWFVRGVRFHYYLAQCGEHVPLWYAVSALLAGFALTGTPGKVGEAVKGVFSERGL